jgi:DUF1009 family protein
MPAIGPETVARVVEAGLDGIALEAGSVLVARRFDTIFRADEAQVFVAGFEDLLAGQEPSPEELPLPEFSLERLGWVGARQRHSSDIAMGAAVVAALAPYHAGQAVVVVRRHVLAVEAGEGVMEMLERASRLKQWGRVRARRRSGVVVLADARDLSRDLVQRVARAGFDGVAVMDGIYAQEQVRDAIECADHEGLFVMECRAETGDGE